MSETTETRDRDTEALLFSRTDKNGIIVSGNEDFITASHFSWEELSGSPHSILRHADMPKAIFKSIWDALKSGKAVGVYLKNKTNTNEPYWVFAVISQIADHLISVSFKPCSDKLEYAAVLYKKLLAFEEGGASVQDSQNELLRLLDEDGYENYQAFVAEAMSLEMEHRDQALLRTPYRAAINLHGAQQDWVNIVDDCQKLTSAFGNIDSTPQNMQIQAAKFGAGGYSLKEIARFFEEASKEMNKMLSIFEISSNMITKIINSSLFQLEIARLQKEVSASFELGLGPEKTERSEIDRRVLALQEFNFFTSAFEELEELSENIETFIKVCNSVERTLSGFDVTRIMCEVETATLDSNLGGIQAAIAQLDAFSNQAVGHVAGIKKGLKIVLAKIDSCGVERPKRKWGMSLETLSASAPTLAPQAATG